MAWTYFPLSVGDFPAEAVWQELIDAINESVRIGGGSGIPSPSASGQMLYSPSGTTWELLEPTVNGHVIQVVDGVPVFQYLRLT